MNCEMAQRTIALAALSPGSFAPAAGDTAKNGAESSGAGFSGAGLDPASLSGHRISKLSKSAADRSTVSEAEWRSAFPPAPRDRSSIHAEEEATGEPEPFAPWHLASEDFHPEDFNGEDFHGEDFYREDLAPGDFPPGFQTESSAQDPLSFFEPGDLPPEERDALAEHLASCRECQAELAATAAFYRALSQTPSPEPTPSLIARARLRLDSTLDNNAHQNALARLLLQLSFSTGRLRAAPGLASSILLLGLIVGGYGGYRAGHSAHNDEQTTVLLDPDVAQAPIIANVSSIHRELDSETVTVDYDRLVPESITGSLDDPSIRKLLIFGILNGTVPGIRDKAVDLIANECRNGHTCDGGPIRNALLNALRTNRDPQERIVALDGLEPYIAEDLQVRNAVLHTLMDDTDADVRTEAVRLLAPVEVDSTVRQVLHAVSTEDSDVNIRDVSRDMLNGIPQVQ